MFRRHPLCLSQELQTGNVVAVESIVCGVHVCRTYDWNSANSQQSSRTISCMYIIIRANTVGDRHNSEYVTIEMLLKVPVEIKNDYASVVHHRDQVVSLTINSSYIELSAIAYTIACCCRYSGCTFTSRQTLT